jgi:pyridoxamine 5'-phosphate oxidase
MASDSIPPIDVATMRRDYMQRGLHEVELAENPFEQFALWLNEAVQCKAVTEPNAMVLSTVSADGQPHARYVLLKGVSNEGFVFFTNQQSDKGHDLAGNARAALTFGWLELERQVRIEGTAVKTPREAVENYFRTRPRGSRLGSYASEQSRIIPNRRVLEARLAEAEAQFPDEVPPPADWGGYCLSPERMEFWQGRTNRLHDRLRYRRDGEGWIVERLAP